MKLLLHFCLFFCSISLVTAKQIYKAISDTNFTNLNTNSTINYSTEFYPTLINIHPEAKAFIQQYTAKQSKEYQQMKVWGKPYFNLYESILTQYQLPPQLKYLSVIESSLQAGLVSWAGAAGPWQLMPYEAKKFGLIVTKNYDERTNFFKSTHAAAKLLKELYETFGDWLLVIAAYNAGVGNVKKAIQKSGSTNFWNLQYYLPEETRMHVKKYIGTHYIFEGVGGFTTMTASETNAYNSALANNSHNAIPLTTEELNITTTIEIKGRYVSTVVAKNLLIEQHQFNKWNVGFDKKLAEGNVYTMRIEKEKVALFETKKSDILFESINKLLNE